jgi:hypothetical protein
MGHERFEVPDDEEIFESLGLWPDPVAGEEPWVRRLTNQDSAGRQLILHYDSLGRSVSIQLVEAQGVVVEILREGAVRLLPARSSATVVTVEFRSDDQAGSMELDFGDPVRITEKTLFR